MKLTICLDLFLLKNSAKICHSREMVLLMTEGRVNNQVKEGDFIENVKFDSHLLKRVG